MSESDDDDGTVEFFGNKIFFIGNVTQASVQELIMTIYKLKRQYGDSLPIELDISSEGGCLFSGFRAYDAIKEIGNINTIASGLVASAGTLIFMAGAKRFVNPNAFLLIHQLSTLTESSSETKFEDAKSNLKNDKKLMKTLKKIYTEEADIPEERLSAMLQRDTYITARHAIKWAIAEAI